MHVRMNIHLPDEPVVLPSLFVRAVAYQLDEVVQGRIGVISTIENTSSIIMPLTGIYTHCKWPYSREGVQHISIAVGNSVVEACDICSSADLARVG